MSNPFVAEIRMVPFNFAPKGWALCNGQLMAISQNTALFSLLGTTYGGDGKSTFALPNLQGSMPLGAGQGPGLGLYDLGQTAGEDTVQLLQGELPSHTHPVQAVAALGGTNTPQGTTWAEPRYGRALEKNYTTAATDKLLNPIAIAPAGGGLPHNNLPPYLTLNFVIALQGVYPPRS